MSLTAIVPLDKEAVILAGLSDFGPARVAIDPADLTPEERAEIVRCNPNDDGEFRINENMWTEYIGEYSFLVDNSSRSGIAWKLPKLASADAGDVRAILQERIAARQAANEKESHELEAKYLPRIEKILTTDLDDLVVKAPGLHFTAMSDKDERFPESLKPMVRELEACDKEMDYELNTGLQVPTWIEACDLPGWLISAHDPLKERCNQAKELAKTKTWSEENIRPALEAKLEHAKRAVQEKREREQTLQKWIESFGTDEQKARLADGLLPEKEILDEMRNVMFLSLHDFSRFERLKDEDFCRCDWNSDDIEYESGKATEASKREYATFRKIRDAAQAIQKEAVVELRYHRGECASCERSKTIKSVRVKLRNGPFEFSREYACPQPEEKD